MLVLKPRPHRNWEPARNRACTRMSRAVDGPPVVLVGDVVWGRRLEPEGSRKRTPPHNKKPFVHSGIVLRGLAPDGVLSRCSRSAATTQHAKSWHQDPTRLIHASIYPKQAQHGRATAELLAGTALLALQARVVIMATMAGRPLRRLRVAFLGAES